MFFDGTIIYEAQAPSYRLLSQLSFDSCVAPLTRYDVDSIDDEKIRAIFHIHGAVSSDHAKSVCATLLPDIQLRLSYFLRTPVSSFLLLQESLFLRADSNGDTPNRLLFIGENGLSMKAAIVQVIKSPSDSNMQLIIDNLVNDCLPGQEYMPAFHFALAQNNVVASYLLMYRILLQIHRDSQRELDNFIRLEEPGVEQSQRLGQNITETVYTRLRNEASHFRVGAASEHTKGEMAQHLEPLIGLVQKAIEKQ
jgi:hypothetical protein